MSDDKGKVGIVIFGEKDDEILPHEIRLLGMEPRLFQLSTFLEEDEANRYLDLNSEDIGIAVLLLNSFSIIIRNIMR